MTKQPKPKTHPVSIRMTEEQKAEYMRRGGAKWLKAFLSTKPKVKK